MKKQNLLVSLWLYEFDICFEVNERKYHESFNVISHKGYCDIGFQFPNFIMPKIEKSFHGFEIKIVSAQITDLRCLDR
jgi:hypothetical protein